MRSHCAAASSSTYYIGALLDVYHLVFRTINAYEGVKLLTKKEKEQIIEYNVQQIIAVQHTPNLRDDTAPNILDVAQQAIQSGHLISCLTNVSIQKTSAMAFSQFGTNIMCKKKGTIIIIRNAYQQHIIQSKQYQKSVAVYQQHAVLQEGKKNIHPNKS